MSFLDGNSRVATEQEVKLRCLGGKPGEFFRCGFCGHRFVVGDYWRCVFTNDMPDASGNPLICQSCDGKDVRERWAAKCAEYASESWWWFRKWKDR
jgi:hypothetical protein